MKFFRGGQRVMRIKGTVIGGKIVQDVVAISLRSRHDSFVLSLPQTNSVERIKAFQM